MTFYKEGSSHRPASLATDEAAAVKMETERMGVQSHMADYSMQREQQACRDYWAAMYGHRAERASRGGVMWL